MTIQPEEETSERMFLQSDRVWLLALPFYLLLLIFRHEAGHAISAVLLDGATVTEFSILPGISEQGSFVRPHIRVAGSMSLLTGFAPYLLDAVTFLIFFPICRYAVRLPRWIWINLVAFGLFIPLLDSIGNYVTGLLRDRSDIGILLAAWPDPLVHLYFVATVGLYCYGSYDVFRKRKGGKSCSGGS